MKTKEEPRSRWQFSNPASHVSTQDTQTEPHKEMHKRLVHMLCSHVCTTNNQQPGRQLVSLDFNK